MASKKLTSVKPDNVNKSVLTTQVNRSFHIHFGEDIEKKYDLSCCKRDGVVAKKIGQFLSKTVGQDWAHVEKSYKRPTDTEDKFKNHQVIHLEFSDSGRLHGYVDGTTFHVVRIDPAHTVHK